MEWEDDGLIIHTRTYGDNQLIVTLLTPAHGKRSGMVRLSRQKYGNPFQVGTCVRAHWHARLEAHLGTLRLESIKNLSAPFLYDATRLKLITCACTLAYDLLPEHDAHPEVYSAYLRFFESLSSDEPLRAYIFLELVLLKELGYGLELTHCALTESTENLVYVSPKTGRAVSQEAGIAYHDRLLTLPHFLVMQNTPASPQDLIHALILTRYFLEKHLYTPHQKSLPLQRSAL